MTKEMPGLTITVDTDMDTSKLSRKLKAIAKHAQALADELDAIDRLGENGFSSNNLCPECGKLMMSHGSFDLDGLMRTDKRECKKCGIVITGGVSE